MPIALAATALVVAIGAEAATAPSWGGRWKLEAYAPGWLGSHALRFTQKGSTVTGRHQVGLYSENVKKGVLLACNTSRGGKISGTVKGRKLNGTISFANAKGTIYLDLWPGGREFTGQVHIWRGACAGSNASFNATRP